MILYIDRYMYMQFFCFLKEFCIASGCIESIHSGIALLGVYITIASVISHFVLQKLRSCYNMHTTKYFKFTFKIMQSIDSIRQP